ncbi:MAG: NAD(P)-dependent oxidoreductase [Actinobacteria bacterium]|jgi:2-alkyl-3-oxoalkanoate reductase|nr:NAD(P)-dependent oxidoreductase [Actinomycetota bacterium]
MSEQPTVVVTGANGLVGSHVCAALAQRGAAVRAVVRRSGTAPEVEGVTEVVGEFTDPAQAPGLVEGADVLVTTVHPMGTDRATQERVGVEGTTTIATAAREAGVGLLVHVSTASVYDRRAGVGDVDESSDPVPDDAGDYPVTKRDTDARLEVLDGPTRVLVRPPVVLGPGESSLWNTLRPREMAEDPAQAHAVPDLTFAWVHVADLARLVADLATGTIVVGEDAGAGPVAGRCTAVNAAAGASTFRHYLETVTSALGVEPTWDDGPAWQGSVVSERARAWGWRPEVTLEAAMAELVEGLPRDVRPTSPS